MLSHGGCCQGGSEGRVAPWGGPPPPPLPQPEFRHTHTCACKLIPQTVQPASLLKVSLLQHCIRERGGAEGFCGSPFLVAAEGTWMPCTASWYFTQYSTGDELARLLALEMSGIAQYWLCTSCCIHPLTDLVGVKQIHSLEVGKCCSSCQQFFCSAKYVMSANKLHVEADAPSFSIFPFCVLDRVCKEMLVECSLGYAVCQWGAVFT